MIITGNYTLLYSIFHNIVENAINYVEKAEIIIQLTHQDPGNVYFSISDNGQGIPSDALAHIFERFYRVHTGNRHDVKGFGLGLAYVKNVVTNLGGTIHAESEYGKGTTFIISLPTIKR